MKNLTIQEAARRLNISEKTLRRWVHIKKIPARLDEGRYWFAERDINAYLQAHQPHIGEESIYEVVYARLDSIDTRLDEIQKAVERLTDVIQAITTPRHREPPETYYSAKAAASDEQSSSLPGDLELLAHFAKRHSKDGAPPTTVKRFAEEVGAPKDARGRWFADERVKSLFFKRFSEREWFQKRECCPHPS